MVTVGLSFPNWFSKCPAVSLQCETKAKVCAMDLGFLNNNAKVFLIIFSWMEKEARKNENKMGGLH